MSITVSGIVTGAGCLGNALGAITLTVSGGIGPYTYQWSTGDQNQNQTGLSVGLYWVVVTDSTGATKSKSFFVGAVIMSADFTVQNPLDNSFEDLTSQNNGSLQINMNPFIPQNSDPTLNYTYLWNTGATTMRIDNLTSGLYMVNVTHPKGCQQIYSYLLIDETQGLLDVLTCCSGDLAYNYVWAKKNGLKSDAECIATKLILLQGLIKDICKYDGNCITADQRTSAIEKAKNICGCCCAGEDIFEDVLKN